MEYKIFRGKEIDDVKSQLAALRIEVFLDFPYLYVGSLGYEKEYLQTYINSERSFLFAAFDKEKMVGATTCIPLEDETEEVKEPFLKSGMYIADFFYFGESILLKDYRGLGIGNRFFEEREKHAAHFGYFKTTCFCAVERAVDHSLRPENYTPLDEFWGKRGYTKNPSLQSKFSWKDIGETDESKKTMIYWSKSL